MSKRAKNQGYRETPAQETMRKEILGEPMKLAQVFGEFLGPQFAEEGESTVSAYGEFNRRVPEIAYQVINQHELQLSLSQWRVVQSMVEAGIRRGFDEGYLR